MEISKIPDNISGKRFPVAQLSIAIQCNCCTNANVRCTFCIYIDDQRLTLIKIHQLKPFFCQVFCLYGNNGSLLLTIYYNTALIYRHFCIIGRMIPGKCI